MEVHAVGDWFLDTGHCDYVMSALLITLNHFLSLLLVVKYVKRYSLCCCEYNLQVVNHPLNGCKDPT